VLRRPVPAGAEPHRRRLINRGGSAVRALTFGRLPREEAARCVAGSVAETDGLGTDRREVRQAAVLAAEVDLGERADRRPSVAELALIGLDRQRPRRRTVGGGAVDGPATVPAQ